MTQPSDMGTALRLLFEKTGPIRFISHLDLTRAFHRAFARAGLPLKFSEGFSPHPKFSFALPLSVGTESLTEFADFTLKAGFEAKPEAIRDALQKALPAGITVRAVFPQEGKLSEIAFASYRVHLPKCDPALIPVLTEEVKTPLSVQKKNKKGKWVEKDVSAGMESVRFTEKDGGVEMNALLCAAGENYLKPEAVLEALQGKIEAFAATEKRIVRLGVFREDKTPFTK